MSAITAAVIGALAYWIIYDLDPYLLSWQCLNRPLVAAAITGLLLGKPVTGIVMGASIEAIFMGISAIGGSIPADGLSAAIIAVTYTVLTGADVKTGIALALPIGTVMQSINNLLLPVWAMLVPHWEKLAVSGNIKKFNFQNFFVSLVVTPLPSVIILFFSLAYGVKGLQDLLNMLPAFVMTGFNAAAGMMVAVGLAILASMIWSKNVAPFFFVGFILAKVLKLTSLEVAVLGAAIALTMFWTDKQIVDLKNSMAAPKKAKAEEEDFF